MALPAEKLATDPTPGDVMSLADAAPRMGLTDRRLRQLCTERYEPLGLARKNGAGEWLVSKRADPRLADFETQEARDLRQLAELRRQGRPESQIKKALALRDLVLDSERAGGPGSDGRRLRGFVNQCKANGTFAKHGLIDYRPGTFRKLRDAYRRSGIAELVRERYPERRISMGENARAMFTEIMRVGTVTIADAYRQVFGHVMESGLDEDPDWKLPAIRTVQVWWKETIPQAGKTLMVEGPHKMRAKCIPKIRRDVGMDFAAGELLIGDQRTFDFMAREMGDRGWVRFRPKLTAWQDAASGRVVGYTIGRRADSDTILAAFKASYNATGTLPREALIDNGLDYKSVGGPARRNRRWDAFDESRIRSAFERLGVSVHYAMPRAPWAKAIESRFCGLKPFDQFQAGFIGGSPDERPFDAHAWTTRNIFELPLIEQVREQFMAWLTADEEEPRRGDSYQGLSARQAFDTFYTERPRRIDEGTLDVVCRKIIGPVKVQRDGLRYMRLWYGTFDEAVFRLQGKEVYFAVDPIERDSVIICKQDGTPICEAKVARPIGYKSEEVRDRIAFQRRCERIVKQYAPSRDYLLKTTPQQIAERRRLAAKANQIPDAHLPPRPEPVSVEIVRPDIAAAAERLKRAAGAEALRKLSGANAAAEALNRPRRITLADLAAATPTEPEAPKVRAPSLYELSKLAEADHAT